MMKGNKYFSEFDDLSDLSIDYVLMYFEYDPLLFVCKDDSNNLYLCQCTEVRYVHRWLVADMTIQTLKDLINDKIDIHTALRKNLTIHVLELSKDKMSYEVLDVDNVDPLDYPEQNIFLEDNSAETENYLANLTYTSIQNNYKSYVLDDYIDSTFNTINNTFNDIVNNTIYKSLNQFKKNVISYTESLKMKIKNFSVDTGVMSDVEILYSGDESLELNYTVTSMTDDVNTIINDGIGTEYYINAA